jgi:hypothetical protein
MRFSRRDRSFHDVIEGARRQVEEAIAERHRRLRGDRATKRTPAPQLIIPVKQASAEPKPRCASPAMNIASSDAFSRRHLASLVGFEGFRPLRPQAIWQAAVPTLPGSYAVIREASEPRAFSSKAGRVLQRAGPHSLDRPAGGEVGQWRDDAVHRPRLEPLAANTPARPLRRGRPRRPLGRTVSLAARGLRPASRRLARRRRSRGRTRCRLRADVQEPAIREPQPP